MFLIDSNYSVAGLGSFNLFVQLLLDALKFSAAIFSALERYSLSEDKTLMNTVENFTLEQLNLMNESVSEIQVLTACILYWLLVRSCMFSSPRFPLFPFPFNIKLRKKLYFGSRIQRNNIVSGIAVVVKKNIVQAPCVVNTTA